MKKNAGYPRGEQPQPFLRTPRELEYWVVTEQGRIPIGPYPNPDTALANGHSLELTGLWWVEAQIDTAIEPRHNAQKKAAQKRPESE